MGKIIYAHRGLNRLAPENTLPAFQKMKDYAVNWLETDVSITKDGELFILHDDDLDRTTNLTGPINEASTAELKVADGGQWFAHRFQGVRIPTVEQLVQTLNQNQLNVNFELKGTTGPHAQELASQLVTKLQAQIKQMDAKLQVIISSFNPCLLVMMQRLAPQLTYALLLDQHSYLPDWQLTAQFCGVSQLNLENEGLTYNDVQKAIARGYIVNVWTVNDEARMNELFSWGVTGIFTDIAHQVS